MKIFFTLFIIVICITNITLAQQHVNQIDTVSRNELFLHLTRIIKNNYLFPEVGKKIAENLNDKISNGYFDQFTDKVSFSKALTSELRSINGDLHLSVRPSASSSSSDIGMQVLSSEFLNGYNNPRKEFHGFDGIQNLGDGVGYLKLSFFRASGMSVADSYMSLLKSSNAIIIDLRNNHGGTVEMVQYLLSYFFDKPTLIATVVGRDGRGTEHWTLKKVNGKKLPDVPLFILVNNESVSGAEGFSYVIKNQRRGIIVGETTMGAAHSVGTWYINGFRISIPNQRGISPITNTNWESVGVIPDVISTNDKSFDVAFNMAKEAANKYKTSYDLIITKMFESLWQLLEKANKEQLNETEGNKIHEIIVNLVDRNIINEGQINDLGYHYIESKMPIAAEIIFRSNTLVYSNSANTYDSYAETLAVNGKLKESVQNYKKAVKLASEQNTGTEELHQKSLNRIMKILKSKND